MRLTSPPPSSGRCASSGMESPPAKGSSRGGGLPSVARRISSRAVWNTSSSVVLSHSTSRSMKSNSLWRGMSFSAAFLPAGSLRQASTNSGGASGSSGSSTSEAKMTARQAANGRRAHHRCNVLGWPWRMDFSLALASLMASSSSATSMSFLRWVIGSPVDALL